MKTEPDRAALEIAHRLCAPNLSYDAAMRTPAIKRSIIARARRHMKSRDRYDIKKIQAADHD